MRFYKGLISVMLVFATVAIALDVAFMGQGFEKNRHYWYWDLDETMHDNEKWCEWNLDS